MWSFCPPLLYWVLCVTRVTRIFSFILMSSRRVRNTLPFRNKPVTELSLTEARGLFNELVLTIVDLTQWPGSSDDDLVLDACYQRLVALVSLPQFRALTRSSGYRRLEARGNSLFLYTDL